MTVQTDIAEYTFDGSGRKQVNFPPGARRQHLVDVVDSAGSAQTMTGWSLSYVWRDQTDRIVFSKTTGGGGITVGNGSGTNDRATVAIDRTDTLGLRGKYWWALWRTDGTDDDALATGTVIVPRTADQP